jgi:serine/threonine protein kinase/DNA-binding winged helix-turn-helix (wHTH) protein/Tol biopolymer transport system component
VNDTQPTRVRFGAFELDLKSGELSSASANGANGRTILARQPFQLLLMLVEREGKLVTREEIQKRFWPNDTIVEFNHSINVAIGRLRRALGDSADEPQYILTVASRGYRLTMAVEWIATDEDSAVEPGVQPANGAGDTDWSAEAVLTGKTVSHYRVLDILGGGGMGVVYRAEDLKLGRQVAIKFLPSETGTDPQMLQRFEREAQTASSLNHPNICTVYEFGEHEGSPFLVMELLQGQTLRDRLTAQSGVGLPLEQVLDIALQVGGGLNAAHERGIIHRDIKPANIFLTDIGVAKILDFGLAKLLEHSEPEVETGNSSRIESGTPVDATLSRFGMAMGTAGYMSPEQVRGEKLDTRTDLFSFGLVLYEMATGRRAFSGDNGETVREVILHRQQARVRDLNSKVPPDLEAILETALEKDRGRRYPSAAAMRAALERLKRETDSGLTAVQQELTSGSQSVARLIRRRRTVLIALMAGACVVAAAVGWGWRWRPHPSALVQVALTQNSFEAPVVDAAISPNGNLLAFADSSGLNLKVIGSGEVHPLFTPAASRIVRIAWFPDSSNLLFTSIPASGAKRQLWSGSIFGGEPRVIRSDADDASVSADGSEVLFTNGDHDEIWAMDTAEGNAKKLVSREGFYFYHPAWYAGRQRILYLLAHDVVGYSGLADASLESLDLKTGQALTVCKPCLDFGVAPGERIVYSDGSSLWAVPVDTQTSQPTGPPRQIAGTPLSNHPTVSADGKRLVVLKGNNDPASGLGAVVFVADVEDKGRRLDNIRLLTLSGSDYTHTWTPDSRAVVFESRRNDHFNIFKQRLDESVAEPLIAGSESTTRGRYSPDGAWFLFVEGDTTSGWRLMRMAVSGGSSELVIEGQNLDNYYCSTAAANLCVVSEREQNQLVFYAFDPGQKLAPGGIPRRDLRELVRTDYDPSDWGLSPDGAMIAMVRPSNREARIHVISLEERDYTGRSVGRTPAYDVLVEGWTNLFNVNWAADGRGWYICNRSDPAGSTFLYVDLKGHATILQSQLGVEPFWGVPSPDGRHLAFSKQRFTENAWLLESF